MYIGLRSSPRIQASEGHSDLPDIKTKAFHFAEENMRLALSSDLIVRCDALETLTP